MATTMHGCRRLTERVAFPEERGPDMPFRNIASRLAIEPKKVRDMALGANWELILLTTVCGAVTAAYLALLSHVAATAM